MLNSILLILLLIAISAFFSLSEISLAASRKIKLKLLADEGNVNASPRTETAGNPWPVLHRGTNRPECRGHPRWYCRRCRVSPLPSKSFFIRFLSPEMADQISFICSFVLVTSLFILFADLTPKRIGMISPESVAVRIVNPMRFCLLVCRPMVWFFNGTGERHFPPVQTANGA